MTIGTSAVVGVLPAAGRAQRLAPAPCSKEIFRYTCAVWRPAFTEYLHESVQRERQSPDGAARRRGIDAGGDLPVAAVIQTAVRDGLSVQTVTFPGERFIDIGTPAQMRDALKLFIEGG